MASTILEQILENVSRGARLPRPAKLPTDPRVAQVREQAVEDAGALMRAVISEMDQRLSRMVEQVLTHPALASRPTSAPGPVPPANHDDGLPTLQGGTEAIDPVNARAVTDRVGAVDGLTAPILSSPESTPTVDSVDLAPLPEAGSVGAPVTEIPELSRDADVSGLPESSPTEDPVSVDPPAMNATVEPTLEESPPTFEVDLAAEPTEESHDEPPAPFAENSAVENELSREEIVEELPTSEASALEEDAPEDSTAVEIELSQETSVDANPDVDESATDTAPIDDPVDEIAPIDLRSEDPPSAASLEIDLAAESTDETAAPDVETDVSDEVEPTTSELESESTAEPSEDPPMAAVAEETPEAPPVAEVIEESSLEVEEAVAHIEDLLAADESDGDDLASLVGTEGTAGERLLDLVGDEAPSAANPVVSVEAGESVIAQVEAIVEEIAATCGTTPQAIANSSPEGNGPADVALQEIRDLLIPLQQVPSLLERQGAPQQEILRQMQSLAQEVRELARAPRPAATDGDQETAAPAEDPKATERRRVAIDDIQGMIQSLS